MERENLAPIISASAALAGVLISQAVTFLRSSLDKKHDRNKLLRQKYEEMMFHFTASLQYTKNLDSCTTKAEVLALSQAVDARKALSLCLLYFPDLVDASNAYVQGQVMYFVSLVTAYKDHIPFNAGSQALVHDPQHQAVSDDLNRKKIYYENLIVSKAKYYTKA
ncbi:hypothetical protein [Geomonas ferrireducens]|uniref:hypothetical protein n=1 Tax=Geomonas ferrireducens TaxID=2570227 RepID=UPI0010A8D0D0|nr:hypothetical protein [Geomonas ferrireducens]